jgi:hypothetical protein
MENPIGADTIAEICLDSLARSARRSQPGEDRLSAVQEMVGAVAGSRR